MNLSLLIDLKLSLKDNYIDNTGFEALLNCLSELNEDCEIELDIRENNIV